MELQLNPCPKCKNTKITHSRPKTNAHGFCCKSCGYYIEGSDTRVMTEEWNRPREEQVLYIKTVLKHHHNAFIPERIKVLWEKNELEEYISSMMNRKIQIRDCRHMPNGCVAEIIT